jgi:hypothetical protein
MKIETKFQNDVFMEEEPLPKTSQGNESLQNPSEHNSIKPHGKNTLCWAFYVVNDNTQVDGKVLQVMHCMICHRKYVPFIAKTKLRKGVI